MIFQCLKCGKIFRSEREVQKHAKSDHKVRTIELHIAPEFYYMKVSKRRGSVWIL